MIIFGVDPGYDRLGIAVIEKKNSKEELLFSDCIETDNHTRFEERLVAIGKEVETLLKKYKPDVIAIEELFFNTNQKTAMNVAEVRGVIAYLGGIHRAEIVNYSPPQIKTAVTGYGRSDKSQVTQMVERLVRITKKIRYDDEYDAIAVALTASATYRGK